MKTSIQILFAFCLLTTACKEESVATCGTLATVRDLSGFDGNCGWVFELSNGTRLVPEIIGYCGSPPPSREVTDNNPLYDFQFIDGKKVFIGYVPTSDRGNLCSAGAHVKIICLQEIDQEVKE
jgi:hypothetical protein